MPKAKRKITYAARKRWYARHIVRLCKAIAGKSLTAELAVIIEDRIIERLPAALMRKLVGGDFGRPMREAMKLTVPFFA